VATQNDILRWAFSEHPLVHIEMAEWDGQPAGFALWFLNFSTWEGRPGIYLEDLYVKVSAQARKCACTFNLCLAGAARQGNR